MEERRKKKIFLSHINTDNFLWSCESSSRFLWEAIKLVAVDFVVVAAAAAASAAAAAAVVATAIEQIIYLNNLLFFLSISTFTF